MAAGCFAWILENRSIKIRNPDAIRPWQFVLEPLYGYMILIEKLFSEPTNYIGAWNFGPLESDHKSVSWIAKFLQKWWNFKIESEKENTFREVNFLKLDCSKVMSQLGWSNNFSIETSLKWISDWYKNFQSGSNLKEFTINQIKEYESIKNNL